MKFTFKIVLLVIWCAGNFATGSKYSEIVKDHRVVQACDDDQICVRFCCEDEAACKDPNHFDLTTLDEANSLSSDYAVIIGHPDCVVYMETDHDAWEFLKVRVVEFLFCNFEYSIDVSRMDRCGITLTTSRTS